MTKDNLNQIMSQDKESKGNEQDNCSSKDSEFSFMNDDTQEEILASKKKRKKSAGKASNDPLTFVKKKKQDSESEDEQVVHETTHAVKSDGNKAKETASQKKKSHVDKDSEAIVDIQFEAQTETAEIEVDNKKAKK